MGEARKKIIILDDDSTNLTVAKKTLSGSYDVLPILSGKMLPRMLEKISPDLILLDIEMPDMSGYDVIKVLKADERTATIPVIFLTGKIDPESEIKGLSLGAVDYITKPFSPTLLSKRVELHLLVDEQRTQLRQYAEELEEMVDEKTKTILELQNSILKTVAELVESRDNITGGHIERTQSYLHLLVGILLRHNIYALEILKWDVDLFVMSSQLHDVGKISISDGILMKPGRLTAEEFNEMKKHTTYGIDIIRKISERTKESNFLKYAEILAGTHHEKWDGTGYPAGLSGENIPLQGRLMAIADVYDALTNDRPYKKDYTHEEALRIMTTEMPGHFDPRIMEVFLQYDSEFESVRV